MVNRPRPILCIAERNANIRELLRREFGREGYGVLTAGSGAEVLMRLAGPVSVDALVLDAEIADPDGGSLTPLLTRLYPGLPVVLHVYPGFEAGDDRLVRVEKGGDFERLKGTVHRLLETGNGAA
ncbi:response regulator [Desulfovibrio aerotolerans]|uniref:Response regulator n=1 Tax=Solidesulfovibrio aerotolerans TaxID=295255 RepID=A0A7C9N2G9_9BACT|nr:response regulator [Solidesulfovibrio aerotolerans]MYL84777.1 response regulator [Solidesulfovibrio aerotolerans]